MPCPTTPHPSNITSHYVTLHHVWNITSHLAHRPIYSAGCRGLFHVLGTVLELRILLKQRDGQIPTDPWSPQSGAGVDVLSRAMLAGRAGSPPRT